jgi:hypothetical protein
MVGGFGGNRQPWQLGIPSPEFWPDQGKGANYAMEEDLGEGDRFNYAN